MTTNFLTKLMYLFIRIYIIYWYLILLHKLLIILSVEQILVLKYFYHFSNSCIEKIYENFIRVFTKKRSFNL
jgi:hypothetical protein